MKKLICDLISLSNYKNKKMFRNGNKFMKFAFIRNNHTAIIYTDGSYYGKYKKSAGIGLYFPDGEHYNVCEKIHAISSTYSEMMAVYRAIKICELLKINGTIYTDSEHVIRKIYAPNYLTNLKELTIKDFEYIDCPGIQIRHVKAHQYLHASMPGHNHSVGNAIADALAKYGAKM
jgi:ribonuclease HI